MALRADDVDLVRDRYLVECHQAGDNLAFEDLYRRYFGRLYRFCLRRVHDPHEAEELTQEAFARAFAGMDTLGGERRFYPWIAVIAARLCADTSRRRARAEPVADPDPGPVDGGQEDVVAGADLVLLGQAMASLDPRYREVLQLRERHRYSYAHIAESLGVTVATVAPLLWRARRALRREFLALGSQEAPAVAVLSARRWSLLGRLGQLRVPFGAWAGRAPQPLGPQRAALAAAAVLGLGVIGTGPGTTPAQPRPHPSSLPPSAHVLARTGPVHAAAVLAGNAAAGASHAVASAGASAGAVIRTLRLPGVDAQVSVGGAPGPVALPAGAPIPSLHFPQVPQTAETLLSGVGGRFPSR